ncbi:MAG: hypothetical protein ACOVQT_16640 [Rubrivivax sp.]
MPSKLPLLAVLLTVLGAAAQAQPTGLQRCPTIEDPVARLACYDAAMPPTGAAARSLPATTGAPASRDTATAATAAAPDRRPTGAAAFGLPERPDANAVQSIESVTVAGFRQWGPNSRIRLENGQVWQVVDGSSGALLNPPSKVTITKGVWGAYFMTFQERNFSPKVRRLD